jgi:CRISPR-associated protein Cas1
MEGRRMRQLYQRLSAQHRTPRFKRSYDPHDFATTDPINQALSAANACLYGMATAATVALGCSPALGIVHTGHPASFIFDIADQHKADTTIPLAFALHDDPTPAATARRRLRDTWLLLQRTRALVSTIHNALGSNTEPDPTPQPLVNLWDGAGTIPAGTNYGTP